jgi:hypothetical protein
MLAQLSAPAAPLPGLPIARIRGAWPAILGGVVTLLMVGALLRELLGAGLAGLGAAVPANPLFYAAFALFYLVPPSFDFWIFRRLWALPRDGWAAIHKKRIANEALVGYAGEAYFYAWARQRREMVAAPFAAVKDTSILSAAAGNIVTLAAVALMLPFAANLLDDGQMRSLWGAAAILVAMTLPLFVLSGRLFSLPRAELRWVFAMQAGRIVAGSLLLALAWHFALPDVAPGTWLSLTAVRLLVSRLPLVPNKDLLFANFAVILIGQGEALSGLMAWTGALTLLVHVALIGVFGVQAMIGKRR